MSITIAAVTIDSADPEFLAQWWAETLDWHVVQLDPTGTEVQAPGGDSPSLFFAPSLDQKRSKNRLHLDVLAQDSTATVEALVSRGAQRVNIGQPEDADWVVMQDPEGNEFCVLEPV